MKRIISCLLCVLALFFSIAPSASAYEMGSPCKLDLSALIENEDSRHYVELMLDHYLRTDSQVRETLEKGCCAVFLFEGCSDNMDDPELSDLSYYRVSAVCIVLRLDKAGVPYVVYFNDNCSTLPDRPLAYGAWWLEEVGDVGPATIMDGTYELYSVYHGGSYEALHLRTAYEDDKIDAVYMIPDGYAVARANAINIHTRTGNHIIEHGMWSAGCILVGGGKFGEFSEFMRSTYYTIFERFKRDLRVGTITINRQRLKDQMYALYENTEAVDVLLTASSLILPETYLWLCGEKTSNPQPIAMQAAKEIQLMTLPCSNQTDARSVSLTAISKGDRMELLGSIRNSVGNLWYEVSFEGQRGFIYCGDARELGWFAKLVEQII